MGAIPIEQVETRLIEDPLLDISSDLFGRTLALRLGWLLVNPNILHSETESMKHRLEEHRAAHILVIIDGQKNSLGTEAVGRPERHGRMDPVFSGFIGSGGNDSAARRVPAAADDNGFAPQFGFSSLFDGREESIHVQMKYPFHTGRVVPEDKRQENKKWQSDRDGREEVREWGDAEVLECEKRRKWKKWQEKKGVGNRASGFGKEMTECYLLKELNPHFVAPIRKAGSPVRN